MKGNELYVIGKDRFGFTRIKWAFIQTKTDSLLHVIKTVIYDTPLSQSTIFSSYKEAREALEKIRCNTAEITFHNFCFVGAAIDEKNNFSESDYASELKIFELVPKEEWFDREYED